MEVIFNLHLHKENTTIFNITKNCFCKQLPESFYFEYTIINLDGRINEVTYELIKNWIDDKKKSTTYYFNKFSLSDLVNVMNGVTDNVQLKLYPKISN